MLLLMLNFRRRFSSGWGQTTRQSKRSIGARRGWRYRWRRGTCWYVCNKRCQGKGRTSREILFRATRMYVVDFHESIEQNKKIQIRRLPSPHTHFILLQPYPDATHFVVDFTELFKHVKWEIILLFAWNFIFIDSGDDSDAEINEWENQQIRKGVTGAQVIKPLFPQPPPTPSNLQNYSLSARNGAARISDLFAVLNQINSR